MVDFVLLSLPMELLLLELGDDVEPDELVLGVVDELELLLEPWLAK